MNTLAKLKKAIQSVNETITDNNINEFQKHVLQLGQENQENQTVITLLKMLRSLGRYLGLKKNKAHADSIPVLNSIADKLEIIINHADIKKDEDQQILSQEIEKFFSLKNQLGSRPSIPEDDLNALKAVILAIDWEISEATLQNFETVTSRLLENLKNYKIHHTFIKIIDSLGRFIGRQKANAPTDSIAFLRSVFAKFEQIVLTPDMSFKDKKYLLGIDINRFHEFKQKIYQKPEKQTPPAQSLYDESIKPALSHIKHHDLSSKPEQMTLTTFSDSDEDLAAGETEPEPITPALAGKKESPAGPKDIMDDLFSTKESPADELLDAIHLQEINHAGQARDVNMRDQSGETLSDGVKNLTPERPDNEPIPEIGDRLDEFFNLDTPADTCMPADIKTPPAAGASTEVDSPLPDGIVPFQEEDESIIESMNQSQENENSDQDSSHNILNRLKKAAETSQWLQTRPSITSFKDDITFLENIWKDNPEKTGLVQIISRLVHIMEDCDIINETDDIKKDIPQKKPSGVLGKIKATFRS